MGKPNSSFNAVTEESRGSYSYPYNCELHGYSHSPCVCWDSKLAVIKFYEPDLYDRGYDWDD